MIARRGRFARIASTSHIARTAFWLLLGGVLGWGCVGLGQILALAQDEESQEADEELAENVFQPPDRDLLRRISLAKQLLQRRRYSEAVAQLGTILEGPQDFFFQPNRADQPRIHQSLKSEAQRLIGRMSSQGLEIYRLQFGTEARRMLEAAVGRADAKGLADVSRRFFHTEAGYEATLLLGLHYRDHAHPLAAALTLQRLQQAARDTAPFEPTLSLALASCWLLVDEPDRAEQTLLDWRRRAGGDTVTIAGRRVTLFDRDGEALAWLKETTGMAAPLLARETRRWSMFRGDPARNASAPGDVPLMNLRWRIPVTEEPAVDEVLTQLRQFYRDQNMPTLPCMHPLAVDDVVLMRTWRNLLAVDFVTGKRLWEVAVDNPLEEMASGSNLSVWQQTPQLAAALGSRIWNDATYGTLSSDGRSVFSIEDLALGVDYVSHQRRIIRARAVGSNEDEEVECNRLAAHDIHTGKLRWQVGGPPDAAAPPLGGAYFLGPPLPLMGQLYVLAEIQGEIRLLVLDPATGKELWSQQLAVAPESILFDPLRRSAGISPAYADGILVCPTGVGAVVGVDLGTRSLLWGHRYGVSNDRSASARRQALIARQVRQRDQGKRSSLRWSDVGLTVVDGCVLLSPLESDSLVCLDLVDGRQRWSYPRKHELYVACVHGGNVVMAGNEGLSAVKLKAEADARGYPQPAWGGHRVTLPPDAMPSGRGFLAGKEYLVPLSSGQVVAVDLDKHKIVQTVKSRYGQVPGNLVCYKDKVISQSGEALEVFYQLDAAREETRRRLAANADDPEALALQGELLLEQGQRDAAIEQFRRAYAIQADPRCRTLLRDALFEGLRADFAAYRDRADEIEALLDEPSQRVTLVRLLAAGMRGAGEYEAALEHCLKLVDLDPASGRLENVSNAYTVRLDRWVQAELAALRAEAPASAVARIDGAVRQRLDAALDSEDANALRVFLQYFGGHPISQTARARLVGRLEQSGRLLEAEMVLWRQQASADRAEAAAAVLALAELLARHDRLDDAAACYRLLGRQYAEVVCRDGRTGGEVLTSMAEQEPLYDLLGPRTGWPTGRVDVETNSTRRLSAADAYGRFPLELRGNRDPFLTETTLRFDHNRRNLMARDGLGVRRWEMSLVERADHSSLAYRPAQSHARACGHLLVVSVGEKLMALDTLNVGEQGEPQLRWSRDLTDLGLGLPHLYRAVQLGGMAWPIQHSVYRFQHNISPLGAVTCNYIAFQSYGDLTAVDPLTGETLWTRRDAPAAGALFGDEQYLVAVDAETGEAMVFRAIDGALVARRNLSGDGDALVPGGSALSILNSNWQHGSGQPRNTALGRHLLLWETQGNRRVLRLCDPSVEGDAWEVWRLKKDFSLDASLDAAGDRVAAVCEPDGEFTLVSLPDGKILTETKLAPTENFQGIYLLALGEHYLLVTNSPRKQHVSIQPMPGTAQKTIYDGRAYLFDRQGRSLWAEPVAIENQNLLADQPGELPVIVFASHVFESGKRGSHKRYATVLCIDKRTGEKVLDDKFGQQASTFELSADAQKKTIDLQFYQHRITLTFTDQPPVPPAPPKLGGALFRAVERAVGEMEVKEP